MFKKILLILITSITIGSLTGCSLFSSDKEEQDTAVAEEGAVDESTSDDEVVEATDEGTPPGDDVEKVADSSKDEEEVVDEYPDDDYGDDKVASSEKSSSDLPDQPVDGSASEETLYVDGSDSAKNSDTVTESIPDTTTTVSDSLSETKAFIPVRKMKKTPFNENGALLNRLYIARDGDTVKSVAEKIYGDGSKSKNLLTWNPHFKAKGLTVGDKVYYTSPRNPTDNSQILLYYEEAGVQPSYYTAKNGDSIRKVSQNLLGHSRSWMEVWATNDIESKWDMPAGTQLRYWPSGTTAAPIQASAQPEETPAEEEMASPPTTEEAPAATAAAEATPSDDQTGEEPPPADAGAAATVTQNEEPPPPPPTEATPPPPPPPEAIPTPESPSADGGLASMMGGEGNDSMMMAVLGGLLILAALILLVFIRRGRKKAYG